MNRLPFVLAAIAIGCAGCAGMGNSANDGYRVATFNMALNMPAQGDVADALAGGNHEKARQLAAIIQTVRPDILLINEIDHDPDLRAVKHFTADYLDKSQFGQPPIYYEFQFVATVNTGVSSGVDLNRDGKIAAPDDAHGWGNFPGQYGMLVLSRYPIDIAETRTFQNFLWSAMPGVIWPQTENGREYYGDAAKSQLRLSSKSHWDVAIDLPNGRKLHLLASHPTPPVFDGPEDRNGLRNRDEIRFWSDYISGANYIVDDRGRTGGLGADDAFVIAGDLNADPFDSKIKHNAIVGLLDHPRTNTRITPESRGAVAKSNADKGLNETHSGPPRFDTSDWDDERGPGNMRVDYVLPSESLELLSASVYWPVRGEEGSDWIEASDHRLVWIDIR